MATSTLKTRIKHKIDTASNWASSNLVPLEGELVIYKGDKPQIKVGDGSTAVGSLPFIKAGSDITVTQVIASGTKIASIEIDGVLNNLYAPSHSFSTGSANGTIAVDGIDIAVKGLGTRAFDSTEYLPLSGGTLTGSLSLNGDVQAYSIWSKQTSGEASVGVENNTLNGRLYLYAHNSALGLYCAIGSSVSKNIISIDSAGVTNFIGNASTASSIAWSGITGKPSTFTPSEHTHNYLPAFITTTLTEIAKAPSAATSGWYHVSNGDATIGPTTNHGSYIIENDVGTPYQIFFPDNSLYMYKRYSVSGSWNSWSKMSAGYADSAATASTATYAKFLETDDTGACFLSTKSSTALLIGSCDNVTNWSTERDGTNQQMREHYYSSDGTYLAGHIGLNSGNYSSYALPLSGGTLTGNLKVSYAHTGGGMLQLLSIGENEASIGYNSGSNTYWVVGKGCGGTGSSTFAWWYHPNATNVATLTSAGVFTTSKIYGAVWNDYAEFRQTVSDAKPGQVVVENGDGSLTVSSKRLQPGCEIVSDTFGFAIGETDECKTPIACAGRVLVYTYENRYDFQPGEAVCSGPNGTVSRMTREEMINNPDCIVGFVSEIPEYEVWGTGNVEVDGRIWIKVK